MQKLVIVRDWIILADDDSVAFDFRTPSSIFYVTFTCLFSLIMDYLRMDGKQYVSKVRNKALEDFDWLSQWLE